MLTLLSGPTGVFRSSRRYQSWVCQHGNQQRCGDKVTMRREGEPIELFGAYLYLYLDATTYTTGAVGLTSHPTVAIGPYE
jgi:hypothetical protein